MPTQSVWDAQAAPPADYARSRIPPCKPVDRRKGSLADIEHDSMREGKMLICLECKRGAGSWPPGLVRARKALSAGPVLARANARGKPSIPAASERCLVPPLPQLSVPAVGVQYAGRRSGAWYLRTITYRRKRLCSPPLA